jgi:hypothetical protein
MPVLFKKYPKHSVAVCAKWNELQDRCREHCVYVGNKGLAAKDLLVDGLIYRPKKQRSSW